MLLGIEKANPERRVTRPLSRASAWSRKCFKRSVDRRSKNVNWRASIETFVRFLEIEGQGHRKTPIEIVDVGWERDSVSDELLEGAPESFKSGARRCLRGRAYPLLRHRRYQVRYVARQ